MTDEAGPEWAEQERERDEPPWADGFKKEYAKMKRLQKEQAASLQHTIRLRYTLQLVHEWLAMPEEKFNNLAYVKRPSLKKAIEEVLGNG